MKSSLKLLNLLVPLFALSIIASGCYTQLATIRDEDQTSARSRYDESRPYDDADTVAVQGTSDYDEDVRGNFHAGFDFYYPPPWYWDSGYGDPYYYGYGYGYPGYYGYPYSYYGYGYGYFGAFVPYYAYRGYPFVTYAGGGARYNQTRNSGYRRSGFNRGTGLPGGMSASVSSSFSLPVTGERSSSQGARAVATSNRRSGMSANQVATRRYVSVPSTRVRSVATQNRPSAPRGGSSASRVSRVPASRSRGYSGSPTSGYYRYNGGSPRTGNPSSGSPRSSSPSYTPSPSTAPSSPSPSSSGSSGGSRSSGSTRTGRN